MDADEDCTVSHKDKVKIVISECQVGEQILLEFAAAWLHPRLYPSLVRATRLALSFAQTIARNTVSFTSIASDVGFNVQESEAVAEVSAV